MAFSYKIMGDTLGVYVSIESPQLQITTDQRLHSHILKHYRAVQPRFARYLFNLTFCHVLLHWPTQGQVLNE